MSTTSGVEWKRDFGIDRTGPPTFFASKNDLGLATGTSGQQHVLRRAFELFDLDGVVCTESSPLIYFKQVTRIDTTSILQIHRRFWNHGGAPILVLIAPNEIQIHSGLSKPIAHSEGDGLPSSLIEVLDRTSTAVREFLPAVESGEYFRRHPRSFNPEHRVDRLLLENLEATREKLSEVSSRVIDPAILDALLCRLVFTCYLFDRNVIGQKYLQSLGVTAATNLRDLLAIRPRSNAKTHLYNLFRKLGEDFNGDLFNDDLDAEAGLILVEHIELLDHFFSATDVRHGQQSFWPYDFGVIPIETISAIYERFLTPSDKNAGTFYTPRFLVELVLDATLTDTRSLLTQRVLDPACGSGIFLVGLFNRMAEEWTRRNPDAPNDRRSRELMEILTSNLFGVDINPTACRITAFSLYLAYLDQLSLRNIQDLQKKGRALPSLVNIVGSSISTEVGGNNVWCEDFFAENVHFPNNLNFVIGNPPWGSTASSGTSASSWCGKRDRPLPDKQIAAAFIWKAPEHVTSSGRICFVLPYGILFNHNATAISFQEALFETHKVNRVVNLADFQRFLFEESGHSAIVIDYGKVSPSDRRSVINYWTPKVDWAVARAEVINISEDQRCSLTVQQVLDDLQGEDAPQIWKQRYWATSRDRRLLDRLALYPRLRESVRQASEIAAHKPWIIAEGFQPVGPNDNPAKAKRLRLPSNLFIKASSEKLNLFLLEEDCDRLRSPTVKVRERSNTSTQVFEAPHVLVAKGFTRSAFANFAVSFRHALRGITGASRDTDLLAFLAAYLHSSLAKYFLFHTSSNWGVSRQEVHVDELLRLPFPLPNSMRDPEGSSKLIQRIAYIVISAAKRAEQPFVDREELIRGTENSIEPLLDEYFDILPEEKLLVRDTVNVIIPSFRPTQRRRKVPTLEPATAEQRDTYKNRLVETLSGWADGQFTVRGQVSASESTGIGLTVLEKIRRTETAPMLPPETDLIRALDQLRLTITQHFNAFEMARGIKVFEANRLYIVKPLAQRFWTQTAALNDADEIAGCILMHVPAVADEHFRTAH
jgi:hypothetical protein